MTEKKEIFHPWGKANINQTELWLSHLAEEGWALESVQGWRFIFRSASPHYRCYFLYRALDINKHWSGPDDILIGLNRYIYKPYRSLKNDFFEIVSQDIHECNSFFRTGIGNTAWNTLNPLQYGLLFWWLFTFSACSSKKMDFPCLVSQFAS